MPAAAGATPEKFGIKLAASSLIRAGAVAPASHSGGGARKRGRKSPMLRRRGGNSGIGPAGALGGSAVQETGTRNAAFGAEKFGFEDLEA